MNKKKKVLSSIFLIVVFIGIIGILYFANGDSGTKKNNDKKVNRNTEKSITKEEEKLALFCRNAPIYKMNQDVEQDSWKYRVTKAYVTKKQGDWFNSDEDRYTVDESGYIKGKQSFVIIEYSLELVKGNNEEYWLNYNHIIGVDKETEQCLNEEVCVCQNLSKKQAVKKDAFKTEYKKGDKKKIELVYVVEDSELKDTRTLFWRISHNGMSIQDTLANEQSFVELKLEEKK